MACTVVTAFYPIRSKFSKEKYIEWGHTFLQMKSPIVLFTEESMIEDIKKMRKEKPIKIIVLPFEELESWKLYKEKWTEHHFIDPEQTIHTPELYAIWAQKPIFVEIAISINPYDTNYFFWCDFGAFRDSSISPIILNTFPSSKYLPKDKIILQAINDLQDSDKIRREDGIYGEKISNQWNEVRLVGGLWGGGKDGCLLWRQFNKIMLEKYFKVGRFAGKDQMVMLSTYLENPELAIVIKSTLSNIDQWFFFQYLLSDFDARFELNDTYIMKPVVSVNIMGGLGNQLFQIATAYAYARKYDGQLLILRNKKQEDGRELYWNSVCSRINPYLRDTLPNHLIQWNELSPCAYTDISPLTEHGIYINGYLQSSKYFYNDIIKNEIKDLFQPTIEVMEYINKRYINLINHKERVIVVHARRTDYLRNQDIINFHGPLTIDYYKNAIKKMSTIIKKPIFLLCSDDVKFWMDHFSDIPELTKNNIYILNNESDINIFGLLQQFHYYIIANSTFSWWAAWMAKEPKHIIAPSKWFGPSGPKNYQDIYEENWELI